ncbi:MAG: MFS transporter [Firmicutes bacterium]|nr:MFS transporter [Candidatus Caballimonas caccae]
MKLSAKHSVLACYTGYIIQAIVNNIAPLLYAHFSITYDISLGLIGLIATINFCVQILIDLLSPFIKKLFGLRCSLIFSHLMSALGLIFLGILPRFLSGHFLGIIISTIFMAIGGGLSEVFLSPVMQAIPSTTKEKNMVILHSFYGFGQFFVVILSSLFFVLFGIDNWFYLPFIWALIPIINLINFLFVPLFELPISKEEKNISILKKPVFWLLFLMMISAGASEIAIATWASAFAELGLHVSKTVGDILGVSLFALFMGLGRLLQSLFINRHRIEKVLFISSILCVLSYCVIVFVPNSFISLLGCAFSGFFVSLMWPATLSIGAKNLPNGGSLTFSLFAFGGDIGCSLGSYLVGLLCEMAENGKINFLSSIISNNGYGIRTGIFFCLIFPLITVLGTFLLIKKS